MTVLSGFTGSGKPVIVDVPAVVPHKRLDESQRAHIRSLIAREHQGEEPEIRALNRVIAKTSIEQTKLRGISTPDGIRLSDLVAIRMENLCAYRAEIDQEDW